MENSSLPVHWSQHLSTSEEEDPPDPWPVPSRETIEKRWEFRRTIKEQTLQFRRIRRHGGMGETGRNIALALFHRENKGAMSVVLNGRRRLGTEPPEDNVPELTAMDIDGRQNGERTLSNGTSDATKKNIPLPIKRATYPMTSVQELRTFAEYCSVVRYHSAFFSHLGGDDEPEENGQAPSSSKAVSTISIAFSPDSQTMASTHGDHTVKITCCSTGRLVQTLEGHPRTPWTVKYHPIDSNIVASGCLGYQVRVWNWPKKVCTQMIRLEYAIISLSFHPTGHILAIASGSRLHFWDYENVGCRPEQDGRTTANNNSRGVITEIEQRHMLRCVHFPPGGNTLIVGGMNPSNDESRRSAPGRGGMSGGGMSFYLRLWDFDLEAALRPFADGDRDARGTVRLRRKAIGNPRTFVPRALLYNDGGFDVSPDGKVLCACAEYWLPEGINSAMELLQQEERLEEEASNGDTLGDTELPEAELCTGDNPVSPAQMAVENRALSDNTNRPHTPAIDGGLISNALEISPPRQRTPFGRTSGPLSMRAARAAATTDFVPRTPPNLNRPQFPLSPPSPPGRRFVGGLGQRTTVGAEPPPNTDTQPNATEPLPPPPPPPPPPPAGATSRPPHPLSIVSGTMTHLDVTRQRGRYVPHVVTVSLDTAPILIPGAPNLARGQLTSVARGYRPRLGQLIEACPLDGAKASAVTCVKFSPSTDFCILGYGVREPLSEDGQYHPVTALYRVRGGMTHISTMLSEDDDVNIARFHPDSGYGFVYGTKQGRVRVLSPRPWNYYNS